MDKHSNVLLWVVAVIFIFGIIMTEFVPTLSNISENETNRLEVITNGGDYTPPSDWTPGN